MGAYFARRLLHMVLVILGALTAMFIIIRLSGDPTALFVSDIATEEEIARIRAMMGFDQPLLVQYVRYLGQVLSGDLGLSFRHFQPVRDLVFQALKPTVVLTVSSLTVALLIGIVSGIAAAVWRNTWIDYGAMSLAVAGQSTPVFLTGILGVLLFAVTYRWFPTSGWGTVREAVLPVLTLALFITGRIARTVRSAMLEVLSKDYVRTAQAKGLAFHVVIGRHALKNAAIPLITIAGATFATTLGGAVVTETIFGIPGLGRLMVQAVTARDFPVAQGAILLLAFMVSWVNLLIDFLYVYIDRRMAA